MNTKLKTALLLCIPIVLIPILVLVFQKYQIKSQPPKQISKPLPIPTTSIPIPTHAPKKTGADLSYIMISGDKNISIFVKDQGEKIVGETHLEGGLDADGLNSYIKSPSFKEFLFEKPESGIYTATISNPNNQSYKFEVYLYDKDGNPKIEKFTENKNVVLQIDYNKENPKKSVIQKVTK